MALQKNKVKFGLNKVHWAKITAWSDEGMPTFATPVRLPGAVSLSIDANGENENFYADNCVYYVINNNAGYDGDLEVALITTDFATAILGEQLDSKGVLVERNDAETSQFALMFEFDGDKNHIRHVLYCCSASRPATEGETTEESKSVKTETLSLKATALPSGLVKSKTCESTDQTTYDNWYNAVYIPTAATVSRFRSRQVPLCLAFTASSSAGIFTRTSLRFRPLFRRAMRKVLPSTSRALKCSRISPTSWLGTLIRRTSRTIRTSGSKRSTHSPFTRCCRSSLNCGGSTWRHRRSLKKTSQN